MPSLRTEDITELELPSSTPEDPARVTIDLMVSGGVVEDFQGAEDKSSRASSLLAKAIKTWNFCEPDGTPSPITADTIRRLPAQDWNFLADKLFLKIGYEISAPAVSTEERKSLDTDARSAKARG